MKGYVGSNGYTIKIPHSNLKMTFHSPDSRVGKCSCGPTFDFASERGQNMKLRMHLKFCSNPPESSRQIKKPYKGTTLGEQQLNKAERIRRVHENNQH